MSRSDVCHFQADSNCFSHGSSVQVMPLLAQGPEWPQVSESLHWACRGSEESVLRFGVGCFQSIIYSILTGSTPAIPSKPMILCRCEEKERHLRGFTGKDGVGTLGRWWHAKISGEQWRGRPRHIVGSHSFVLAQACGLIRKLGYFREVMVKKPLYALESNRPCSAVCHAPKAIDWRW